MIIIQVGKVIVTEAGIEINDWHIENGTGKELYEYGLTWAIEQLQKAKDNGYPI